MTRYYKLDEDGNRIEYPGYIDTGHGTVYPNPTPKQFEEYGWIAVSIPDPEPEVIPQSEPDFDTVISKLKVLALPTLETLDDEAALEVSECFPTWESLIGQNVATGTRIWDDGALWRVVQGHVFTEEWRPGIDTASLFVKVQIHKEEGTIDNPIQFSLNMELISGKYYSEDNVKYLCTRELAAAYWHLSDLVGQYVEVVE